MKFYVLAGGQSRRMGTNKALLKLGNQTLIERVLMAISPLGDRIKIISNHATPYLFLRQAVIGDIHSGLGPIGGIHAGLMDAGGSSAFFISCDTPLVSEPVVRRLTESYTGEDVLGYVSERGQEPLCAIYSSRCLPAIERQIAAGRYSLQNLLNSVRSHFLPLQESWALINLNDSDDYELAQGIICEEIVINDDKE